MGRSKNARRSKRKCINSEEHRTSYSDITRRNELFERYYQAQTFIDSSEFQDFLTCLQLPLPTTFRITASDPQCAQHVENKFLKLTELINSTETLTDTLEIKKLNWYLYSSAWQINIGRFECKKQKEYNDLKQFFILHNELGLIRRQELVSMLPVLVLDVKPSHQVLDMCAAPGSKTSQIIECLHSDVNHKLPDGFLIANDVDRNRAYTLAHQLKSLHSPAVVVVNHDATCFPNIRLKQSLSNSVDGEECVYDNLLYDRILCDVPCTGDGTLRKAPEIWTKWNPAVSFNLHGIQHRIAQRALELLKPGGRMLYSTCSLNPIENESVVNRLLQNNKGAIRLIDINIDGVKMRPGVQEWRVMSKDGQFINSFDDCPEKLKNTINRWMFSDNTNDLRYCKRILPHDQNSGGFFLALLEKIQDIDNSSNINKSMRMAKKRKEELEKEGSFLSIDINNVPADIRSIRSLFSMEGLPFDQLLIRGKYDEPNNVYFVCDALKQIISLNSDRIKFLNCGVRIFARTSFAKHLPDTSLRLCDSGLPFAIKYCQQRVINLSAEDMILVLSNVLAKRTVFTENLQQKFAPTGCVILIYDSSKIDENDRSLIAMVVGMLTIDYLRPFIGKKSRYIYLSMMLSSEEADKICQKVNTEELEMTKCT
ncbi:hypothetical protein GJ496_006307 [Pomphorhynchus laevis]|nr:hypothetical protein GJ496_006307 [Pomphorhynchus laevis]